MKVVINSFSGCFIPTELSFAPAAQVQELSPFQSWSSLKEVNSWFKWQVWKGNYKWTHSFSEGAAFLPNQSGLSLHFHLLGEVRSVCTQVSLAGRCKHPVLIKGSDAGLCKCDCRDIMKKTALVSRALTSSPVAAITFISQRCLGQNLLPQGDFVCKN